MPVLPQQPVLFLLATLATACTHADAPPAAESQLQPAAATDHPRTESDPSPAKTEAEPVLGYELRAVYRNCWGDMWVRPVAGEVYVTYVTDGYGRIDRFGRGSVVERQMAIDFDPGAESRAAFARLVSNGRSQRYEWPGEPLVDISSLAGLTPDDLFVPLDFATSKYDTYSRLTHYRNGHWSEPDFGLPGLREWPSRQLLASELSGYHGPRFARVHGRAPAPSMAPLLPSIATALGEPTKSVRPSKIEVLDIDHSPSGPLVMVLTYKANRRKPLGTWVMGWFDSNDPPRIERLTKAGAGHASVVVEGAKVFVQLDGSLYDWSDAPAQPLPTLADAAAGACDPGDGRTDLRAVDANGQLWATVGACLGVFDGQAWAIETLPSAGEIMGVAGVEFGTVWATDIDTVWAKVDEGWRRVPLSEVRDASEERFSIGLWVTAPGEAWVVVSYRARDELPVELTWSTDLYTNRPVDEALHCRTSASP